MSTKVRAPTAAGRFYPGKKSQLLQFLNQIFCQTKDEASYHAVSALIVPHASYEFSGLTAARAFSCINPRSLERVVIIGPSHYIAFHGISIAPYDLYRTPLGDICVDISVCDSLFCSNELFIHHEEAHIYEHALEVELPFIQKIAPDCKIIPLITGDLSLYETRVIADRLLHLWDPGTLIVISSDFTHYGQQFGYCPFTKQIASESLEKLDHGAIQYILQKDAQGFADYVTKTGATICGRIPITILLALLEKSVQPAELHLVEYTNSGKILNDYTNSVSYASILADDHLHSQEFDSPIRLTKTDKRLLLKLAHDAIAARLRNETVQLGSNIPNYLYNKGNIFVTIRIGDRLRGCIGCIKTDEAIINNVIKNAENAAFEDPRFPPLTHEEFDKITIEISYLTPPRRISSVAEIVIGKHGIILEMGSHRAVFLPQVAIEQEWDKETTLENLSLKAGLNRAGWYQQGVLFFIFETISFGANDLA